MSDDDWRTLHTKAGDEPRPSRVAEQQMTAGIRRREQQQALTAARRSLAAIRDELQSLERALVVAAPAVQHRDTLRMVRRGLANIERTLG